MSDTSGISLEQRPAEDARALSAGEQPGDLIDRFTLVEEIGEGGMGTVWLAQQEQPVQRQVALKIIKLGMDTRQVVARFEAERQALALMDHPSISKVYDAGVTETGRPYFVMELVLGAPITEFCNTASLPTAERLALFRQVCLAVQHAHQKGILHRDLKPSNIRVTKVDGVPQPKVIDFGIAKAMENPLTDSSLATEAFQVMGTPEYMPPEQASGRDVDTRADVYSLGVVLYELLTGAPPFWRGTGGLDDLGKLLRQIHDVTPPKPSTRASELGGALEGVARTHGAQSSTFTRALRGDLDWIVMKALEKDRERRYATALELADDIARHLGNEPVVASPPSTTYRLRKFMRRNRLAVGSGVVVSTTLVAATIGLGVLYARALSSEAEATREAETSRQALGFVTEMFEVSDPSQARGETVTAREILDRGAERIERELGGQPEVRSTLMATMGSVYRGLGLYDRAEELIQTAATTRRALSGEEHPEALRLSSELAGVQARQSRFAKAEDLLRDTIERQKRVLGPEHVDTLASLVSLSQVLEARSTFDEAEVLAREAQETARRTLGENHELTLAAASQLGLVFRSAGRYDDAERQFLQGLEARRRVLGEDHPDTLLTTGNLAWLYMDMGRFDEAEARFVAAQETVRRVFGEEHLDFLKYRSNLGLLYREQGRLDEAEALYREIIEIQRRTRGDDHLDTLLSINSLGVVLADQGRLEETEVHYREALEGLRRVLGEENEHTLSVFANMAILFLVTDRAEEAETFGRAAYEGSLALHGEDHPLTLLRLENLSNVLYKKGDEAGVVQILNDVLAGRRRALGNDHPAVTRTLVNLSVVQGTLGDQEGATAVREELLERARAGQGLDYASVADEIEELGRSLIAAEKFERAAECVGQVLRIRLATLGAEDSETLVSMRDIMELSIRLQRWADVESFGREYYEAHVSGLGKGDPKTRRCVELLLEGYEQHGDDEQAGTWWEVLSSFEE